MYKTYFKVPYIFKLNSLSFSSWELIKLYHLGIKFFTPFWHSDMCTMTVLLQQIKLITHTRLCWPNFPKIALFPTHHWVIPRVWFMNILSTGKFYLVLYKCESLSLSEAVVISSWQSRGTPYMNKHCGV